MLQYNIKIVCFADSNPDNVNKKLLNIPVLDIKELLDMRDDAAIIVGGLYMYEVAAELEKMEFKHIFFDYSNGDFVHLDREDL